MVCDDEPNMGFIVRRMLEREGLEVIETRDGKDCLGKIKDAKPDLLLLDLMMPEMSGWDVLERIRLDEELRSTPVAILSVLPFTPTMLREKDLDGVVDYILKPFNYKQLTGSVMSVLDSMKELSTMKELLEDVDAVQVEEYRHAVTNRMLHSRLVQFLQEVVENGDKYHIPAEVDSYQRVIESERRLVATYDEKSSRLRARLLEDYYRKAMEDVNVGISIKTKPGTQSFHSRYFSTPVGRNCYDLNFKRDSPCEVCPSNLSLEDGKTHTSDIVADDGRILNVVAVPLKNPDGTYSALELVTDVTERRQKEDELARRNAELEGALELKELFIDIMRHDILNPIGVIGGTMEYLQLESSPENVKEAVQIISRSCKRIEDLVENARVYSKLETIKVEQFVETDLCEVINDCVEAVRGEAKGMGIKIKVTPEGPFMAHVNLLIGGVFTNLLTNAVKYSQKNTVVWVEIEDELDSWKVGVKDQGAGIADEYKDTIFERFKRGERGGVRGTGLGLAIASRITEIHNGRIWVEDNPAGKGSIFYVTIPKKRN